jgi:hypothetical protein
MKREIMTRTKEQKEKRAAYDKIWYQKNRERKAATSKIWYQENKEKIAATNKIWRQENKESLVAKAKVYYQENREKIAAYNKVYQQENREKVAAREKVYRQENKEKVAATSKIWYQENKEKVAARGKIYRQENKEKVAATKKVYQQERYKNDPDFKISQNVRRRLRLALKGNSKAAPTMEIIGCTIEELWLHLESKFEPGMTRENHGRFGWHIDHKKPCCAFDLSDLEQQKICFHYSNLQPLWAKDNLEKGGNYNEE